MKYLGLFECNIINYFCDLIFNSIHVLCVRFELFYEYKNCMTIIFISHNMPKNSTNISNFFFINDLVNEKFI